MKLGLVLGAVALAQLASCLPTGISVSVLAARVHARPAEYEVDVVRDAAIPARDGTRLSAELYHPRGRGPFPTILVRVPLSRTRVHESFADLLGYFWAQRGYHVAIAGLRGRFHSAGRYEPLVHEREDGLDTLAWLDRQPFFDGRLGMWGGSVFGYTQWVLADQKDPGPKALFMQICSSDNHRMFYPGGAFSLSTALYWSMTDRGREDVFPTPEEMAPGLVGWPVVEADDRTGRAIPTFDAWATHRTRDAYWREIDGGDRPEKLVAPALLLAGWYDPYLPSQLEDYRRIRAGASAEVARGTRLVIGPWAHAREVTLPGGMNPGDYRFESIGPSLPFYDALLSPPGAEPKDFAPVRIFVMGENRWRDEAAWPLARAKERAYYLGGAGRANTAHGDGRLALAEEPTPAEDFYIYDPQKPVPSLGGAMLAPAGANGVMPQNAVEQRRDVLVYSTEPFAEPVEVTGPVKLVLHVETTAPATDFTGKLLDVYPDGTTYNLSEGILRRAYGRGVHEVKIEMWPTSNVFKPGHRLRLEVSSSNYPRFDRHPNTLEPPETAVHPVVAYQTVHHGGRYPSRLVVQVVPR